MAQQHLGALTDVRCPVCQRKLFTLVAGAAEIEVLCVRCHKSSTLTFASSQPPSELMTQLRQSVRQLAEQSSAPASLIRSGMDDDM